MARWTKREHKLYRTIQLDKKEKRQKELEKIAKKIQRQVRKEKAKERPDNFISKVGIPSRVVDIKPVPAPRMVRSDTWKKRPCVVRYFKYKEALKWLLSKYVVKDELYIIFLLPVPESWSMKKKKAMVYEPHKNRPDTDNLLKAFKDSLLVEDSHIHVDCAAKRWAWKGQILVYEDIHSWQLALKAYDKKHFLN